MLRGSKIENEGRFIHLGIDVFSKDLEAVYSPCDGEIVTIGNEPEDHSFGHFLIIEPDDLNFPYVILGHLDANIHNRRRYPKKKELLL